MIDEEQEAKRRLTNIKVPLISLVDLGANGEPFFVVKSLNGKESPMSASRDRYVSILSSINTAIGDIIKSCDSDREKEFDVAKVQSDVTSISKNLANFTAVSFSDMPIEIMKEYEETPSDRMRRLMWQALSDMEMNGELLPSDEKKALDTLKDAMRAAMVPISDSAPVESSVDNSDIEKRGSKMASARLSKLKKSFDEMTSIGKSFGDMVSAMKSLIEEIENKEDEGDDMSEETTKSTDESVESVDKAKEIPEMITATGVDMASVTKSLLDAVGEQLAKALAPIQESIAALKLNADKHEASIEKMALARGVPHGGNVDGNSEHVEKSAEADVSFASIMPATLRGVVRR